ncbi:hypothetical protein E4M00_07330 [Leifsonia flava]|uniref:DUF6993 domain-containing protein n=1 Tax=Orlajensenia leifsoniae TaxID=2561933 RepID=A0A4Y9R3X0_9MICO|nr:hypothetical protein E4M00_07330 [Leifsonia flava]
MAEEERSVRRRNRLLTSAALIIAVVGALSACTPAAPIPAPTTTMPTASPTPTPTAPAIPELQPGLSAGENLDYFDLVNNAVIAANAAAGGRDFVDALVAGGFDKAAMQVTPDRTAIDLQADSIQWSVLFNGECLIGQYGPASGGYHSEVAAPSGQGACLLGETRPIDW